MWINTTKSCIAQKWQIWNLKPGHLGSNIKLFFFLSCHTVPEVNWRGQQTRGQTSAYPAMGQCTSGLGAQGFSLCHKP